MRIFRFFISLSFIIFSVNAFAQKAPEQKQPRILILLDESSSMIEKWEGGKPRYKVAGEIILRLMDSLYKLNPQSEFALRVFGHQYPVQEHNCYDTKREVMFSKDNYTQMSLRLADIKPLGVTPIAYALKEAAENDLPDEDQYAYSIVLITDGGESCGGDICDVVKKLLDRKIFFKPYILSLVDYAPLRTEYACLGSYLQVTSEKDIPKTLDSIITSFRPAMTLTTIAYKKFLESKIPAPSALDIKIPEVKIPIAVEPEPIRKVVVPVVRPQEPQIDNLTTHKASGIKTQTPVAPPAPVKASIPTASKLPDEPRPLPYENIKALRNNPYFAPLPLHYASSPIAKQKIPPAALLEVEPRPVVETFPAPKPTPPVVVAPPPPKPKPVAKPKPLPPKPKPKPIVAKTSTKDNDYVSTQDDAKETSLEVYFEDRLGHLYNSTPQIILSDPRTGNPMKTFYRTVNAKGIPDEQQIPPGIYNLAVTKGATHIHNVEIVANKKNKVIIQIGKASLSFAYAGNSDRPVTEYKALVTLREIGGRQNKQACTEKVEYEPGSYHVSINTVPPTERYLDLDMEATSVITLQEPGYLQITNTNPVGKATLYVPHGDEYLAFTKMNIDGVPASQKIQLVPGVYKVHFIKDPKQPMADESIIPFEVKSNSTTEVLLK